MEPPLILDSTRVLFFAETGGAATYTGRITMHTGHTGEMVELPPVANLAISEQLTNGELLIMHCDESWGVLGVQTASSIEAAKAIAERAYSGITAKWQRYRDLSKAERAELDEEREVLQRLEREFPAEGGGSHAS